ncbi:FHA domain-containing protein [Gloeocapsa sp. PCC 73106]|uniref:FHA domain-containing protein n=1 Tax=Gloeocapsa sp. PCC 73106 TaxID=102232 RepID=UPI0002ACA6F5|nr:FHA domain-containing protein [Gloeocapsa sp. PCC 73106]ELR96607.1 FHA domain-containing protein [Gloeocapsa sp. PCC 73106]
MLKITVINIKSPQDSYETELKVNNNQSQEFWIGRASDCTIQFNNLEVSRYHGKIIFDQGSYYFTDEKSTMGSWLNNKKVNVKQKYPLKTGDNLNIANCFMLAISDYDITTQPTRIDTRSRNLPDNSVDPYTPESNPIFNETLQRYFPNSIPMHAYIQITYDALEAYGFEHKNTMGMTTLCRDEITEPFLTEVIRRWGASFNCSSLAGFVMMGKTALAAATDHVPIVDGKRRFAFYAMPHIAISKDGEIGKVYRYGIKKVSHACGALEAIAKELLSGRLKLEMDMQDVEQTIVRQKILSHIYYGDKPDLIEMTKLAAQIIAKDTQNLLSAVDTSIFKYAVMTGIQIHGPMDTTWISPQEFYVVDRDIPENKKDLFVFEDKSTNV